MENSESYEWLSLAVKTAVSDNEPTLALAMIRRAKDIAGQEHNFEWLAMAATQQACMVLAAQGKKSTPSTHTEYGLIQSWFKQNHGAIFAGSSLEKIKVGRYIPDFMLKLSSSEVVPVECKKTFNARSLIQLQAYMNHFGSKSGIAVAAKLSVELPENVTFVLRPKDL